MKKFKTLALLIVVILTTNSTKAANPFQTQQTNPPLVEGNLYKDVSNDKAYWLVNGTLRHIVHLETLNHLFVNPLAWILNVPNFEAFSTRPIPLVGKIIGAPIGPAYLLNINGAVYLRLSPDPNSLHYHIQSPQIMDAYRLNWGNLITISNYTPSFPAIFPYIGGPVWSPE